MALYDVEDLGFRYPGGARPSALSNLTFRIEEASKTMVLGRNGSGKTTLLKLLKSCNAPKGEMQGRILFDGRPLSDMSFEEQACSIGYIGQNVRSQLVCDTVFAELAFGLRNLGMDEAEVELRVAEISNYFGMADILDCSTEALSGGQSQLVNVACVLAMRPKVLLLDEPFVELDPIARRDLAQGLIALNADFGMAIVIAESSSSNLMGQCDRAIVLDDGKCAFEGSRDEVACWLCERDDMQGLLPLATQVMLFSQRLAHEGGGEAGSADQPCRIPLSVAEARLKIASLSASDRQAIADAIISPSHECEGEGAGRNGAKERSGDAAIQFKDVWFKYKGQPTSDGRFGPAGSPAVMEQASFTLLYGRSYAVLGQNGCGKSTLLKCAAGLLTPLHGQVTVAGRKLKHKGRIRRGDTFYGSELLMLPQDASAIFTKDTVRLELADALERRIASSACSAQGEARAQLDGDAMHEVCMELALEDLLDSNPRDLSAGQTQLVAIALVLMGDAPILLLDEPTKYLDEHSKGLLSRALSKRASLGSCVVIATHDLEFAASATEEASMMFRGRPIGFRPTEALLRDNAFYTTTRNVVLRDIFPVASKGVTERSGGSGC